MKALLKYSPLHKKGMWYLMEGKKVHGVYYSVQAALTEKPHLVKSLKITGK